MDLDPPLLDPRDAALKALPHGSEFRFLDALIELEPGRRGKGRYRIRGDEPFLRGHFPGDPLMPGVLLVEAAAQLAGTVAQSDPQITPLAGLKLAAIRQARFQGAVVPGDELVIEAEVLARLEHLVQASAIATVGDRLVLRVELTLSGDAPAREAPGQTESVARMASAAWRGFGAV